MDQGEVNQQNQAYREGVLETSGIPVVFVNPDRLNEEDWDGAGEELRQQLEGQVPGLTDALLDKVIQGRNQKFGISNASMSEGELAYLMKSSGPSTIANIMVGDQEFCIANELNADMDSLAEISEKLSRYTADSAFIPGDDADWQRIIGLHEGEHCNREDTQVESGTLASAIESLNEELRADRSALAHTDAEVALAFKDLRHLSSGSYIEEWRDGLHDTEHATGVLLNGEGLAGQRDIEISPKYKQWMDDAVESNLSDISAEDTLQEYPESYFIVVHHALEAKMLEEQQKYLQNPTIETAQSLIEAQILSDYAENYEGAYRRRVLGQDVPEKEPPQYVASELREWVDNNQDPLSEEICTSTGTVTAERGLNMRYMPGIEFEKLVADEDGTSSALHFGEQITIHGEATGKLTEEWRVAVTEDGRIGYVDMDYINEGPKVCTPQANSLANIKF